MAYQDRGSGPPHFDGKNYPNWVARMGAFLRGKGKLLWDVTKDENYVNPTNLDAQDAKDSLRQTLELLTTCSVLCLPRSLSVFWART